MFKRTELSVSKSNTFLLEETLLGNKLLIFSFVQVDFDFE